MRNTGAHMVGLGGAGVREMIYVHRTLLPPPRVNNVLSYDWYYGVAGSNRWGNGPSCDACMSSVHWTLDYYFCIPLRTPVVCSTGTDNWASQVALAVKNPPSNAGNIKDISLIPGLGRSPGGGHDNTRPLFLPGDPHGQRSLVGYSPQGQKELDTTEVAEYAHTGHFKSTKHTIF